MAALIAWHSGSMRVTKPCRYTLPLALTAFSMAMTVEQCLEMEKAVKASGKVYPVSYTHLDVYKRQGYGC